MARFSQSIKKSPQKLWSLISLLAFLCLSSAGLIQKYAGIAGIAAYLLIVLAALLILMRFKTAIYALVDKRFVLFAVLVAVGLVAIFVIVYPMETSGQLGLGSDRDEALNIAVRSIAAGRYPYYERTHLGNAIMQLPGAILLSAPFVALGNSAYQNIFWLLVFVYMTGVLFKDRASALVLLVSVLLLSPTLQYEYISGGDLLANGIYVVVFLFLTIRVFSIPKALLWEKIACSIALGIGLSSRPYYFILIPLLFVVLLRITNMKTALIGTGAVTLVASLVTLPYYLYDPGAFTPLAVNRLASLDSIIPYASLIVIVTTILLTLVCAFMLFKTSKRNLIPYLYWMSAAVQFLSMLFTVVFISIANEHLDFSFMRHRYGIMFLLLGLWGCWPYLYSAPRASRPAPADEGRAPAQSESGMSAT
ncbi:MAG: hypothetical protein JXJ17_16325 [Anaerolineae bacterium]|nr:hypothetical protein [Anaerolineae bacterium]